MTQEPREPVAEGPEGPETLVRIRARGSLAYYEHDVLLGGGLGTVDVDSTPEGELRVRLADLATMHWAQAVVPGGALVAALRDPASTSETAIAARVELARLAMRRSGEGWVRVELGEWESRDVVVIWVTLGVQRLGAGIERDDLRRELDR